MRAGGDQREQLVDRAGIVGDDEQPAIVGQGPVETDPLAGPLRQSRGGHTQSAQGRGEHVVGRAVTEVEVQLAVGVLGRCMVRPRDDEGRLAEPARTRDDNHVVARCRQLGQLRLPADEQPVGGRQLGGHGLIAD